LHDRCTKPRPPGESFGFIRAKDDQIEGNEAAPREQDVVATSEPRQFRVAHDEYVQIAVRADRPSGVRTKNVHLSHVGACRANLEEFRDGGLELAEARSGAILVRFHAKEYTTIASMVRDPGLQSTLV
jgi:hypothetical protein